MICRQYRLHWQTRDAAFAKVNKSRLVYYLMNIQFSVEFTVGISERGKL